MQAVVDFITMEEKTVLIKSGGAHKGGEGCGAVGLLHTKGRACDAVGVRHLWGGACGAVGAEHIN